VSISITKSKNDRRDQWLAALADPTRRRIVEILGQGPKPASELHNSFGIASPAVSRHLRVLREVGLISEHRVAEDKRVRLYVLEPQPLDELSYWLEELSHAWQVQLDSFEDYVTPRTAEPPGPR
jgi:DNA-binding transcriptional ArsR family regulator